jgi:hypothetical protein
MGAGFDILRHIVIAKERRQERRTSSPTPVRSGRTGRLMPRPRHGSKKPQVSGLAHRGVSSMVEQRTFNPWVPGSSPGRPTHRNPGHATPGRLRKVLPTVPSSNASSNGPSFAVPLLIAPFIGLGALDGSYLGRWPVLTPAHAATVTIDEHLADSAVIHVSEFGFAVARGASAGLGREEKEPVPAGHDRPGAGVLVQGAEAVPVFLEAVLRD